jgi:hypothetical protein
LSITYGRLRQRQQAAGWGKSVVEQLAKDIQSEFPGISGFSIANLWRMRSFYLGYAENPAIGIILCKTKDRTIVEYALRESNKQIGVTTYQIFSTLPQEFQGQLPNPTQIAKLLAGIDRS